MSKKRAIAAVESVSAADAPVLFAQLPAHDWREQLPSMEGAHVSLREVSLDDAAPLLALLSTDEVSRFISPPPTTLHRFERFVDWAQTQRRRGEYACFAVGLKGMHVAIGLFQVRSIEPGFGTAEWGFALGSPFWGTGAFVDAANLVLQFSFETVGVHRLEARAAVVNGRGNGALRKIGAVQEGVLRRSFGRHGVYHDQALWSIIEDDWRTSAGRMRPSVH